MDETMSRLEMAMLAAQARANLRRLHEFNTYPAALEAALVTVDAMLADTINDR